jgi:hypothetical protein
VGDTAVKDKVQKLFKTRLFIVQARSQIAQGFVRGKCMLAVRDESQKLRIEVFFLIMTGIGQGMDSIQRQAQIAVQDLSSRNVDVLPLSEKQDLENLLFPNAEGY